ncbi:DUF2919 family protein [Salinivibrio sp. ES.052]|uniref:DUF2919 family protein n=1 Tax=Salinivibrio sp. ES.052 TaxID=1882823 RepID=UPI00092B3C33|nr:DUF2919 family protein [Salinivibrio sp. ES.052]SIN98182.1 Protein of unknown function [Salinivibrio sp. ES.052]
MRNFSTNNFMDTFHHFDDKGYIKAPQIAVVCLLLLSRSWWLLAMAGVSRQHGSELLALIYPDQSAFYLSLAIGLMPLCFLFLIGNCDRAPAWLKKSWSSGYWLVWFLWGWEAFQVAFTLAATEGQFDWLLALHGLWLAWASLYWARSRRVKRFFNQFSLPYRERA